MMCVYLHKTNNVRARARVQLRIIKHTKFSMGGLFASQTKFNIFTAVMQYYSEN